MTVTRSGSGTPVTKGPASGHGGSGLAIWTEEGHNRCTLVLRGRLGADNVSLLDTHVDLLGGRSCDEVVLDLRELDAIDQVGARVIVGFGHYVAGRGGRFRTEGAIPAISSMIARAEIELAS